MEVCTTCGQTKAWHEENQPRHAFTQPGEDARVDEPPTPPMSAPRGGDPILRLALIRAGLITDEDIAQTQRLMNQATENGMALVVENGEFKFLNMTQLLQRELEKG